jgi:hypothetical protein
VHRITERRGERVRLSCERHFATVLALTPVQK